MPVEAAMKRRTFPILLVLLVFLFTSCNGILQEEDEYGQASSFTLIDGDESSQISATNPFTVLLFTDVHVGRESRVPASYQPYGDLNTWVGKTFPVTGNPQVMITLGDLTDNSTDGQYQGVKDLLDAIGNASSSFAYTAAAIGNHDNRNGGQRDGSPGYWNSRCTRPSPIGGIRSTSWTPPTGVSPRRNWRS
jgi:hypothetical protein